jgi:hypothetical protein
MKARGIQPRTPGQTGKLRMGPKFNGAIGALSLVGDIFLIYQAGDAAGEEDPNLKAIKVNMLACSMWAPTCRDMVYSNGYVYHFDGWEWVNTGRKATVMDYGGAPIA